MNDTLVVQQSLINHLFYLRTMREFALNIQLSFFGTNATEIQTAEEFGKKCEELGERTIQLANDKLFSQVIDSNIFVTPYTLDCELLTEKLFHIDINTLLTEQELQLVANDSYQATSTDVALVTALNQEAMILAGNFIDFCSSLLKRMKNQELFSYSYPLLFTFMIQEIALYQRDLERLIEKSGVDPVYISGYEYRYSESMKNIALFVRGLSDPNQSLEIEQANNFIKEYQLLMSEYQNSALSPDNQERLREQSLELTTRFKLFLTSLIQRILSKDLYFIIEPIFFDNCLTEINYFLYLLYGTQAGFKKEEF